MTTDDGRALPTVPMDYALNICQLGKGRACCRYLVVGGGGLECGKWDKGLVAEIDARVGRGEFTAQGDNCAGYEEEP